jgi:hypothetical protein
MKEPDIEALAGLMAAAIKGKDVKADVNKLRGSFTKLQYV